MKNFLFLLITAALLLSCKKDNSNYIGKDPDMDALATASIISTGKVTYTDERVSESTVTIYLRKDGIYVVELGDMNYKSVSGTNVYLSTDQTLSSTSIKVYSDEKLHGNIYSKLSYGINPTSFKYIVIQGNSDSSPVATAALQ